MYLSLCSQNMLKKCAQGFRNRILTDFQHGFKSRLISRPEKNFLKSQYYVALRHFPEIKFRLLLCHSVLSSVSSDILIEYKWQSSQHISQLFIENLYFVANNLSLLHNNKHIKKIHKCCYIVSHYFSLRNTSL